MDLVDESKEDITDNFLGNDNEQDVLNTQLSSCQQNRRYAEAWRLVPYKVPT